MLIAGDIGGTKTLLAIYNRFNGAGMPVAQQEYRSANYGALDVMVREFLRTTGQTVQAACFDVAGPVMAGRAQLTNLPWTVDAAALTSLDLDEVFLLNDLTATAYAVPQLEADDLHTINAGRPEASGSIAVIAPGTGLGEGMSSGFAALRRSYTAFLSRLAEVMVPSAAEFLKIEIVGRSGSPKAQGIDGLAAMTNDRPIERNADQ